MAEKNGSGDRTAKVTADKYKKNIHELVKSGVIPSYERVKERDNFSKGKVMENFKSKVKELDDIER